MQKPKQDPMLIEQQRVARDEEREAIQDKVGTQTLDLMRQYAQRAVFAGGRARPGIARGL